MSKRSHILPLLACVVLATILTGCRNQKANTGKGSPQIEALRFPHERHAQVACAFCHPASNDAGGQTLRPGSNQHASCAQSECHAIEFRGTSSEICALCHDEIGTGPKGSSPLVPFPPEVGSQGQPVAFSHAGHLDADAMEAKLGFHVSCVDCHFLDEKGLAKDELQRPNHAACARCHAPESAPEGSPTMAACESCHQENRNAATRERELIQGDLRFSHRRHRTDRKGALISCATCHLESTTAVAEQAGRHAAPPMSVCVDCHDDALQVDREQRMRLCETCHITRSAGLGALPPLSHLPATERPADHTRAFRRDHAADAYANSEACGLCHTMLSGNRRDTCDECHQVMRPSDHMVTWREYDHGPEAATAAERCTTCHQTDFCVACHQTKPRSHFPLLGFRDGGHGTQALLNMRACVTCHTQERDCNIAGCHQGQVR